MLRIAIFVIVIIAATSGCTRRNEIDPSRRSHLPPKMVWASERPEDLRFLEPTEFGVAFLAQTIFLEKNDATPRARRQPLEVTPGSYVIAVTRIETAKAEGSRPAFDDSVVSALQH